MEALSPVDALRSRRVYIDANIFMYFLDGSTQWAAPAATVLAGAGQGDFAAVTGEAAVAEVMVGPYRTGDSMLIRSTREFFAQPRFVEVIGHPQQVWDDAAMLRGTSGVPLIDGLHIATAAHSRCDTLVTNDSRMKPLLGVDVVPLSVFL
jgi:predicted nucleic acid-binding protein